MLKKKDNKIMENQKKNNEMCVLDRILQVLFRPRTSPSTKLQVFLTESQANGHDRNQNLAGGGQEVILQKLICSASVSGTEDPRFSGCRTQTPPHPIPPASYGGPRGRRSVTSERDSGGDVIGQKRRRIKAFGGRRAFRRSSARPGSN